LQIYKRNTVGFVRVVINEITRNRFYYLYFLSRGVGFTDGLDVDIGRQGRIKDDSMFSPT
jgi:hypothetical protein